MKNMKLATKISIIVISILTLGLVVLWRITDTRISSVMETQIMDELNDAIETRGEIIEQYIASTEAYLVGYGQFPGLKDALRKPDDAGAIAAAQQYTESYGKENPNLEKIGRASCRERV